MRNLVLNLMKKETKRRLLAALFLIFFVGELGSHVAICVSHSSADQTSISANENGHDDPCKYLVLCGDGTRKNQLPNFSHDPTPYNGLLDRPSDFRPQIVVGKKPRIKFAATSRLYQPPSPPFHPPELS